MAGGVAVVEGVVVAVAVGSLLRHILQLLKVYYTHAVMKASLELYSFD